jgi:hypothetical protein
MGKLFIGICCQITLRLGGPSYLLDIGSLDELLILIGPLFKLKSN